MPYLLKITGFDDITAEMSVNGTYSQKNFEATPEFNVDSIIWNTGGAYDKYRLAAPYTHIKGNQNVLEFSIRESSLNSHMFSASGHIKDILAEPYLTCKLNASSIDLREFSQSLTGDINGDVLVEGSFDNLTANGRIHAPELYIGREKISDLELEGSYNNKLLTVSTNDFNWRNQKSVIEGNLDFATLKSGGKHQDIICFCYSRYEPGCRY
ncbi:MAG: hypothetical protein MZV63_15015 [Marinilabiliales bacterium]|nr:hypothetical protein [Marinilabiliales bacterium]